MKPRRFLVLALPLAVLVGLDAGPAHAYETSPRFVCGTPDHVANIAELKAIPAPPAVPLLGGEKLIRDPFGTHQKLTSANFTVNWNSANLSTLEAQRVLDAAEDSWAVFVTQLGHPPPTGCETYRLNIYVSWTEDNPSIDYDGGYATIDNQGYPYLVISKNLVDSVDAVQGVVSHEIYHDFQMSLDAYWNDEGSWYWEATAEWGAQQVYPESSNPYGFVGAVALTQELSLYFMGDPFAQDPTGQHQYGAGLFPRFVTDTVGDPSLVPQSWLQGNQNSDPLDVLGNLAGGDIDPFITDFYAHNAHWDYPQVQLFGPSIAAYEATYPQYQQLAAPLILSNGTDGLVDISPNRPLHEHGAHQLVISAGEDRTISVEIDGEPTGSSGTAATWEAVFSHSTDEGMVYTSVPFDGADGAYDLVLPEGVGSARLTVIVHGDGRNMNETFDYRIAIAGEGAGPGPDAGPGEEPGDPPPGCCSTGGGASGSLALTALALVLGLSGRRRTRRSRG